MICRSCNKQFNIRAAKIRRSQGTGGSSHPLVFVLLSVVFALISTWLFQREYAQPMKKMDYTSIMLSKVGPWMFLILTLIAAGSALTAYTDYNIALCPHCGCGHTRWPWSRP